MKIRSIKKIDYNEDVYNLHVEDNHNYFANNHCVSNCHTFDDVMSSFISINISKNLIKKFKFSNEYDILKGLSAINNITDASNFLKYLNSEILQTMDDMENGLHSVKRMWQKPKEI